MVAVTIHVPIVAACHHHVDHEPPQATPLCAGHDLALHTKHLCADKVMPHTYSVDNMRTVFKNIFFFYKRKDRVLPSAEF